MLKTNINPFFQLTKKAAKAANAVTVKDLFTENNPQGYFSGQVIAAYAAGISDYQQRKFTLFLEYMGDGHPITNLPLSMNDDYGNEILWVKFRVNGTPQSFRMHYTDWLLRLVKDYQKGLLRGFVFSADELAEELAKTGEQ